MTKLRGKMRFLSSIRIVRVTLALAVVFWMAGGGCLLGCESMLSAASAHAAMSPANTSAPGHAGHTGNLVVAGDACASMHSHDCCARRGVRSVTQATATPIAKATIAKTQDEPDVKQAVRAAAKAARPQTPMLVTRVVAEFDAPMSTMMDCPLAMNATAALPKARPDTAAADLLLTRTSAASTNLQEQLSALSPPSLLPNRGHTYLRCCVFLI